MSGEGGTERLESESWLSDRCGENRWDRSQFASAERADGGVAGTLDTGVVMMSLPSPLRPHPGTALGALVNRDGQDQNLGPPAIVTRTRFSQLRSYLQESTGPRSIPQVKPARALLLQWETVYIPNREVV